MESKKRKLEYLSRKIEINKCPSIAWWLSENVSFGKSQEFQDLYFPSTEDFDGFRLLRLRLCMFNDETIFERYELVRNEKFIECSTTLKHKIPVGKMQLSGIIKDSYIITHPREFIEWTTKDSEEIFKLIVFDKIDYVCEEENEKSFFYQYFKWYKLKSNEMFKFNVSDK